MRRDLCFLLTRRVVHHLRSHVPRRGRPAPGTRLHRANPSDLLLGALLLAASFGGANERGRGSPAEGSRHGS